MITGFHIEPTNICSLRCPGCARTDFLSKWPKHWKNASLDINQLDRFLDIDLKDIQIHFCGNYGDPIYHPDLMGLITLLQQRGSKIRITTNGSHRPVAWWEKLARVLTQSDQIIFSIDGLPTDFTHYRINGNWKSIEPAIRQMVNSPATISWKYIVFNYNQNEIDDARSISQELGFDEFILHYSDRWNPETERFRPTVTGPREKAHENWNQGQIISVNPLCNKGHQHYISAQGRYVPCCFVGEHRFYYKTIWPSSEYDITKTTFSQLMQQSTVINWYQNLENNPPLVCQFNCPKTTS